MNFTETMAEFFAELAYEDIPKDVRERAKLSLLDSLGMVLAGVAYSQEHNDEKVLRFVGGLGDRQEATMLGYGLKSSTRSAAFGNGCMIELLDWQDSTIKARIHGSSSVSPATFAMAEYHKYNGRDLLTALVAGYEVATRVGLAVQPTHWRKGFQATGTVNTVGVAAAVGHLFGFDGATMANALGIAGHILPISNGDGVFGGYSIKLVHGGQAAMAGIEAALLAQQGFTAGPLEGIPPRHHALLNITSDSPDPQILVEGLGSTWYARDIWHKPYPVGLLMIGPVEAAIELSQEYDIKAEDVEGIEIKTYADAVFFVSRHHTDTSSTVTDCQLSLPYCVAIALTDRKVGPEQFTTERIQDPKVHALAERVRVSEDAEMNKVYPAELPHMTEIVLKDGRRVSKRVDKVWGSPERSMTESELTNKFVAEVQKLVGTDRAGQAVQKLVNLEDLETVTDLVDLLCQSE